MAKATEIAGIECHGSVADAVPQVLASRIEEMYALRERALDFKDPEGVHDIRVASRRLRSALRDFAPYLKKATLAPSLHQLKDLADCLGVVRDYDVAIIALEKLQTKVTPDLSSGLQKIIDAQKAKRGPAQEELTTALGQEGLTELRTGFVQVVKASIQAPAEKKTKSGATHKNATNYKVFARTTLLKRLKDLEKASPSLYKPQNIKPLHEMRIEAKRLRYALELFGPCWGESLGAFSRQVAQLQSSLGELHDCDLWIEFFGKRLGKVKDKAGEQSTSPQERDAMIWLLSHFTRSRTKHFRAALARWHDWETKDFCNRLTATLRT